MHGAQMWKEEEPGDEAVSVNRLREALATGAQTVAVACPFCLTMLADAGKELQSDVAVKDVVELAAERLCDSGRSGVRALWRFFATNCTNFTKRLGEVPHGS